MFGWETEAFDLGGAQMTMWKLPGYVGGEPEQPVSRDVVATMVPPAEEGPGGPARWTVDFWVTSLDDALRTIGEFGGQVAGGPYDVPEVGMRQAVIADPQGATLSLTLPPQVG